MLANTEPNSVIYCRVSSKKQLLEGNGLRGQEMRCRDYAKMMGYRVLQVFEERGISGGSVDRAAMAELLEFLDTQTGETVVIIDDLKRFAREVAIHFDLKLAITKNGGRLESPLFRFEDSPEGKFFETIGAAQAELERTQNRRQVFNRTRARLEQGFWTFRLPPGLMYTKDAVYNKVVAHDPTKALLIKQGLMRFASGSLSCPMDLVRFFEAGGLYGSHPPKYTAKLELVTKVLRNILYTGYLEYKPWNIALRKAYHPALIDLTTYQSIQSKLNSTMSTFTRSDVREEFPLRNFVSCATCGRMMTASWSKGRTSRYPYYHCQDRNCPQYGRTIAKAKIEAAFEALLARIAIADPVLDIVKTRTLEVWQHHVEQDAATRTNTSSDLSRIESDLRSLADKLGRSKSDLVSETLEARIEELSTERRGMLSAAETPTKTPDVGTAFDTVRDVLKNPLLIWKEGDVTKRRLIVRLAFLGKLKYDRTAGFGTTELSLPYLLAGQISRQNCIYYPLVDEDRKTWNLYIDTILEWAALLKPDLLS
jgi:DNA invertase Pin-like site-specific DNA recombinase